VERANKICRNIFHLPEYGWKIFQFRWQISRCKLLKLGHLLAVAEVKVVSPKKSY